MRPIPVKPAMRQPLNPNSAHEILQFWFEQSTPKQWFQKDAAFDRLIADRFGGWVELARAGALVDWRKQPANNLALVLVLDQFTRHVYRNTPCAFAGDEQALNLSQEALGLGWVQQCPDINQRKFWLMPMMHSEAIDVQRTSLPLFERHTDADTLRFARRHCEIIERFGRFPHRNAILGRTSTEDELAFLAEPGSSF